MGELRRHAEKEKLQVVEFLQESRSAKTPGRPVFNEMIRRIVRGEADGILAWHPDRLARNALDGGQITQLLDSGKLVEHYNRYGYHYAYYHCTHKSRAIVCLQKSIEEETLDRQILAFLDAIYLDKKQLQEALKDIDRQADEPADARILRSLP